MFSKLKEVLANIKVDKELILPIMFEYTTVEDEDVNTRTLVHPVTITQEFDTLVIDTKSLPLEQEELRLRIQLNSSNTISINDTVYTYTDTGEELIIDKEFKMKNGTAKLYFTEDFYELITKSINSSVV